MAENLLGDDYMPAFPTTRTERAFTKEAMTEANLPDALAFREVQWPGMSLRDYFAAKALEGLAGRDTESMSDAHIVERAYKLADFMLAARAKGKG